MEKENKKIDIFKDVESNVSKDISETKYEYIDDYTEMLKLIDSAQVSAEQVGEMIVKMTQHYTTYNLLLIRALKMYTKVTKECFSQEDSNGKPISAAKAQVLADASPEAIAYKEAKIHLQNIEQNINALKAFQRGLLNEYVHQ